ncbi:MAG: AAA family ATPase [Candidatus Harrisonbacteria bacterium]|nr:AAA family ATPase [Candidatus Harrisonbacteria bacterium]
MGIERVIIGLVGKPGAGKSTFKSTLEAVMREDDFWPSVGTVKFSDSLFETLKHYGIPTTRENLQWLGQQLESKRADAVTVGFLNKMRETEENPRKRYEIIIADGVRWLPDETAIREMGGIMVYIMADPALRYERVKTRREKESDESKTWEEFLKEDQAPNEIHVHEIGCRTDFKIDNNCTIDGYKIQARQFYQEFIKPLRNKETPH